MWNIRNGMDWPGAMNAFIILNRPTVYIFKLLYSQENLLSISTTSMGQNNTSSFGLVPRLIKKKGN
jgi:hypothetical protein